MDVTRQAICRAGLHARPAAIFVAAVREVEAVTAMDKPQGAVRIRRPGGEPVAARSIVSVLSLDIQPGETVVLTGAGSEQLDRLAALLEETDQ